MKIFILASFLALGASLSYAAPFNVGALLKASTKYTRNAGMGRMTPLSKSALGKLSHLKGATFAASMQLDTPIFARVYISDKNLGKQTNVLISLVTKTQANSIDHTILFSDTMTVVYKVLKDYGANPKAIKLSNDKTILSGGIKNVDSVEIPQEVFESMDIAWMDELAEKLSKISLN